jgi:hypothetical protein
VKLLLNNSQVFNFNFILLFDSNFQNISSINYWPLIKNLKTEIVSNINFFCFREFGKEVIIFTKDDKVFTFWKKAVKKPKIVKGLCDQ